MNDENREIWVGENRFYLGEDDILYVDLVGDYDLQNAYGLRDAFMELLKNVDGKVDIFVDNSRSGKPSHESRKIFAEMIEYEQCGKIAVFGLNPVVQMIASFVLGNSKNNNTKIFKKKEDALAWLKE
jgi:hypothetical protein